MSSILPPIDGRTAAEIVARIGRIAPCYVPEWNPAAGGAGSALTEVFGDLAVEVLQRLNRVPERHLAAFLDLLGLKLVPPQPAETVLVFTLAKDADRSVPVPAGTEVLAEKSVAHDEVLFETDENLLAVPAKLTALYSVIPDRLRGAERIFSHGEALAAGRPFTLFRGPANLQSHTLYLRHDELFAVRSGARLRLSGLPASLAELLDWSYTGNAGREIAFPRPIVENGAIVLTTVPTAPELAETTVNGSCGIWIAGRPRLFADGGTTLFQARAAALAGPFTVGSEALAAATIYPDAAFAGDVPLDLTVAAGEFARPLLPFGDKPLPLAAFYLGSREVFSKKGAVITISCGARSGLHVPIERVQGIGTVFTGRLRAAGIATAGQLLARSDTEVAGMIRDPRGGRPVSSYLLRARNIREATAKAYYDKTGSAGSRATSEPVAAPGLSWEYWNGSGWCAIEEVADATGAFLATGTIRFVCPADVAPVEVGGQRNYWLRVRLTAGDYGKEYAISGNQLTAAGFVPPRLALVTLAWSSGAGGEPQEPTALRSLNNLEWRDGLAMLRQGERFRPFWPLDDTRPAIYAGFDRPLAKGPLGLFVDLAEIDYPRDFHPQLRWEALDPVTGRWVRIDAEDGTADLTRAGIVRLTVPPDGAVAPRFGNRLFWLRGVLAAGDYAPTCLGATLPYRLRPGYLNLPRLLRRPLPVARLSLDPLRWRSWRILATSCPPVVRGIHLNAARARQLSTVNNERPGSGTGLPNQTFTLAKRPVYAEGVWVDEFGTLARADLDRFRAENAARVETVTDRDGRLREVWIRWEGRESLLGSAQADRHYVLDRSRGTLVFGDGIRGRVLPAGANNLKVTYHTGGGTAGNLDRGEIARLRTAIPLVDKAVNPQPSGGGVTGESLIELFRRGPQVVRHRYRAVTVEDCENLIRELFPGMARVKCLPTCDDRGATRTGWLTVLIVPWAEDDRPTPSAALLRTVEAALLAHGTAVVTAPRHAVVTRPTYLAVSVAATLVPRSLDLAPAVEAAALAALREFLHPLRGGWDGRGWPFGRMVCLSDLYALLERVAGVDRVGSLAVTVADELGRVAELGSGEERLAILDPYGLVVSGAHTIDARTGES